MTKRNSIAASRTSKKEYTLADVMAKLDSLENTYSDIHSLKRKCAVLDEASTTLNKTHHHLSDIKDPIHEINDREYRKRIGTINWR